MILFKFNKLFINRFLRLFIIFRKYLFFYGVNNKVIEDVWDLWNIGIIVYIDVGKIIIMERMLYYLGFIKYLGILLIDLKFCWVFGGVFLLMLYMDYVIIYNFCNMICYYFKWIGFLFL